ncbi:ribonucleotide reductase inhibitor-domain-containing protein [Xylariaceae sp. FL0662B]|nr:ribonucleotide reductase inhibitor-domain-containing protein [Xylariaceae sp. FL0662B]
MSAPRTKRQFAGAASDPAQRHITSFFTSNGSSSPSYLHNSTSQTSQTHSTTSGSISPTLPPSVQSNLLSVGMRVRKSVPEGYKTESYSAFALWDESGGNRTPTATTTDLENEGRSRANAVSTPRELLPFCGIHKVGGLDTQRETPTPSLSISTSGYHNHSHKPLLSINDAPLDDDDDDDDDLPSLVNSSQESMASSSSGSIACSDLPSSSSAGAGSAKSRKRLFTEEADEAPEVPDRLGAWRNDFDGEVSPRSLAPAGWGNGRVMAVPRKGRLRSKLAGVGLGLGFGAGAYPRSGGGALDLLDQENVMVVEEDAGADAGDFDEAGFLDRDIELGYRDRGWEDEVEMSDV